MPIGDGLMVNFRMRIRPREDRGRSIEPSGPMTRQSRKQRVFMALFFTVFALAGAGMLYPLGIRPIANTIDAESWPEVPCRIISAKVESHSGDKGTTYSVNIVYAYEFNGKRYESDRYDFIGGSSSGRGGKAEVVNRYRSAANPICFVNPNKPSEAVLTRGFHWGLLFCLFPLPFLAMGVGGLIWLTKKPSRGKLESTTKQWLPQSQAVPLAGPGFTGDMASGSVVLKPESGPWTKVILLAGFAALWNGFVYFLMGPRIIEAWRDGGAGWFPGIFVLFSVPFLLVGVALIGGVLYLFLAAFNPRPILTLSSRAIPLGGSARLGWNIRGNVSRIQRLKFLLRGLEEATYRRGTRTYTDKNTFYVDELYSLAQLMSVPGGETIIEVPDDTMHSFEATNNKIIWQIVVHGAIATWPDMREELGITVTPARAERR